jgi:glycosyltransferase involved in cell wall biosynthesis
LLSAYENHNTALQAASRKSKYCKIVFADDWIFPECIERMVAAAEADPTVGIVGAYVLEGTRVSCVGLPYPSPLVSGADVCRGIMLEDRFVLGSANSLLYRSDLVRQRNPFFRLDEIHADTEVCFELFKQCNFAFVHQVLTYTRVREESLTACVTDVGAGFAFRLRLLAAYGNHYLTKQEIEQQTRRHLTQYYRYLGRALLLRRERKFWEYHCHELASLGYQLSWWRVLAGAVNVILEGLSRPGASFGRFRSLHKLRLRKSNPPFSHHLREIWPKR